LFVQFECREAANRILGRLSAEAGDACPEPTERADPGLSAAGYSGGNPATHFSAQPAGCASATGAFGSRFRNADTTKAIKIPKISVMMSARIDIIAGDNMNRIPFSIAANRASIALSAERTFGKALALASISL
jgi:hypothetical protein